MKTNEEIETDAVEISQIPTLSRSQTEIIQEKFLDISITFPISMTTEKLVLTINLKWTVAEVKDKILQEVKNIAGTDSLTYDNMRLIFRAKTLGNLEVMKNLIGFKVSKLTRLTV